MRVRVRVRVRGGGHLDKLGPCLPFFEAFHSVQNFERTVLLGTDFDPRGRQPRDIYIYIRYDLRDIWLGICIYTYIYILYIHIYIVCGQG